MNKLAYMIRRAAFYHKDKTAVVYEDSRRTFQQVNRRSNRLAQALVRAGVKKGERVAVLLANCPEFIETDFALIKAGLVRLPLNPRLSAKECVYIVGNSKATTLVFGHQFQEISELIRQEVGSVKNFIMVGP